MGAAFVQAKARIACVRHRTDAALAAFSNGHARVHPSPSPRVGRTKETNMYIGAGTILVIIILYLVFR
jgi:hypothetical protein